MDRVFTEENRGTLVRKCAMALLWLVAASVPLDVIPIGEMGSFSVLLGWALVPFAALAIGQRGWLRRMTFAHGVAALFVAWAALSYLWSVDPDASLARLVTYGQLFVFLALCWQIPNPDTSPKFFASAYIAGVLCAAAGTFVALSRGETYYATEGRFAAEGYDPNDLGVALAIAIPVAWYLIRTARSRYTKVIAAGTIPIVLTAIALTGSRGALIATAGAIASVAVQARTASFKLRTAGVVVALAASFAAMFFVPASSWDRLSTIREEFVAGTFTHRTLIWRAAGDLFVEHWFAGVGVGAFAMAVEPLLNARWVAHNAFVSVAVELGGVGLVMFLTPFAHALRMSRRVASEERWLIVGVIGTWALGASSLAWEYRKVTWLVLGIALHAAGRMSARGRSSRILGSALMRGGHSGPAIPTDD